MNLIVVGAGEVTRQLLRRLGEAWDVVVVDTSAERLDALRGARAFEAVEGDGSSPVVLRRAGLEGAEALVAATGDDDVNLEACRIGREASVRRLMAVVANASRIGQYRDLEVTVLAPASLSAREIEDYLQARRVTSKTFADGRIEAMEFAVAPNSVVRGMSVSQLNGRDLLVAALLRRGELIRTGGEDDVTLESGDLVTVVGSATELPDLVRTFTSGTPRFPLDHGKRVAVAVATRYDLETTVGEAVLLTRNSKATSLLALHPAEDGRGEGAGTATTLAQRIEEAADEVECEPRGVDGRLDRALWSLPESESIGLIVLPRPGGSFALWKAGRALAKARATRTPVLFARGLRSHGRILAVARRSAAGRGAARAAIDLAELGKARLRALAIEDPEFMGGPKAADDAGRAIDWVESEASLYGLDPESDIAQGNPVRALLDAAERADLLVAGISDARGAARSTILRHLARDARASVLVVPARE